MRAILLFLLLGGMIFMQNSSDAGERSIDEVNRDFYNLSGDSFDKIPFEQILPNLFYQYKIGSRVLEIGSGAGALAFNLTQKGCEVICVEPAQELALRALAKGLKVCPVTIQNFQEEGKYDSVIAISSLIHVPKAELPLQIKKIASLLNLGGLFFVSFIEGEGEGLEDPTQMQKLRFFAKWNEVELEELLSSYFTLLENHRIYNQKMDRTFLLQVYVLKG